MPRLASILLLPAIATALALGSGLEAQGTAERVVLVARVGKLSEAEVSPSPQLKVPALWKLALEGISLTRVELTAGAHGASSLDELKLSLLPDGTAAEAVDWQPRSEGEGASAASTKALHELFGVPPTPTTAENLAVASFRAALGSTNALEAPARQPTATTADLSWLARSAVTLVRVEAASDTAAAVGERDELLDKVIEKAGPAANIVVVNLPERGAGTVIARGPRLKKARVSEKPRSISAVKGMVSLIFDPTAAEKNPAIAEEHVHEIFR